MNSKRFHLLLLALLATALAAPPATVSAAGWDIDPQSGKFPLVFTMSGGTSLWMLNGASSVHCLSAGGSGKYETATTGTIQLSMSGCTIGAVTCQSPGQPSGKVTTTAMQFHNIFLEPNKSTPGILITPNEEHYATIFCGSFIPPLSGNGLITQITVPKCGETRKTATLNFEFSGEGQKWTQIETEGTKYDLTWNFGGLKTFAFWTETTMTFAENATITC
jgi:hypothetical protein